MFIPTNEWPSLLTCWHRSLATGLHDCLGSRADQKPIQLHILGYYIPFLIELVIHKVTYKILFSWHRINRQVHTTTVGLVGPTQLQLQDNGDNGYN